MRLASLCLLVLATAAPAYAEDKAADRTALEHKADLWIVQRYRKCWHWSGPTLHRYVPEVVVRIGADGALTSPPELRNPGSTPLQRKLAVSALKAVTTCDPLPIPEPFRPLARLKKRVIRFDSGITPR